MIRILITIAVIMLSGSIFAKGAFVPAGDQLFFPASFDSLLSMKADNNGNVYVGYVEDIFYLSIAKFDGGSWDYVGPKKFSGKIGNERNQYDASNKIYVSFNLDNKGVPYAVFPVAGTYRLRVMKYDSEGKIWKNTIGDDVADFKIRDTDISFSPENIPYVAFSGCSSDSCKKYLEESDYEYIYYTANIMKHLGNDWLYVGEPMFSFNEEFPMASSCSSMVFDSKNTPYAVYYDNDGVKVIKFNGTDWVQVGDYLPAGGSLLIDSSDNLYFGMHSGFYKYSDGKWSRLFEIASQWGASYAIFDDIIYTAFSKKTDDEGSSILKVGVKKYYDGNLEIVGDEEFFAVGYETRITVDSEGIPYVAFRGVNGLEVMKFDPDAEPESGPDEIDESKLDDGTGKFEEMDSSFFPEDVNFIELKPDSSENIFAGYTQNRAYSVAEFDGNEWRNLGETNISNWDMIDNSDFKFFSSISLAVGADGKVYASFSAVEKSIEKRLVVMEYDNAFDSWDYVGEKGFRNALVNSTSLAVNSKGELYVAFADCSGECAEENNDNIIAPASVLKYSKGSWNLVGDQNFTYDDAAPESLSFDAEDTPYLVADGIMKFNSQEWENAGYLPEYDYGEWKRVLFSNGKLRFACSQYAVLELKDNVWNAVSEYEWKVEGCNGETGEGCDQLFISDCAVDSYGVLYFIEHYYAVGPSSLEVTLTPKRYYNGKIEKFSAINDTFHGGNVFSLITDSSDNLYLSVVNGDGGEGVRILKYTSRNEHVTEEDEDSDEDVDEQDESIENKGSGCSVIIAG